MRKKSNFLFFEILIFGPLRGLFLSFSSIFFSLYLIYIVLRVFVSKDYVSIPLNYVFWPLGPFLKIKGPLKGLSKGICFKSLKVPHNGIIKTICAKNEVCKSISMTCSTYRRITKDKEENTRKWPKKGPQRAKNQKSYIRPRFQPAVD